MGVDYDIPSVLRSAAATYVVHHLTLRYPQHYRDEIAENVKGA